MFVVEAPALLRVEYGCMSGRKPCLMASLMQWPKLLNGGETLGPSPLAARRQRQVESGAWMNCQRKSALEWGGGGVTVTMPPLYGFALMSTVRQRT